MAEVGRAPTKDELRFRLAMRRTEVLAASAPVAIKWVGLVGIAGFAYLSVRALSGKVTAADVFIGFWTNTTFSVKVSWTVTTVAIAAAVGVNYLRKRTIRRLADRIKGLEVRLDSGRTTSGLQADGSTRKEDE